MIYAYNLIYFATLVEHRFGTTNTTRAELYALLLLPYALLLPYEHKIPKSAIFDSW